MAATQTALRARDNGDDPGSRYVDRVEFNTSGPCEPGIDYMLPAAERLPRAHALIARRKYFVVHAPRQSGKTTTLIALARDINAHGNHLAVCISCESARVAHGDYATAEKLLLQAIRDELDLYDYPDEWLPPTPWPESLPGRTLLIGLRAWARRSPVPIVLLIDEIDTLVGDSLATVLWQLREGFPKRRSGMFPASVVLCGMRPVRDYKAASGENPDDDGVSPFNIVDSLTITNFTREDITTLYNQHTTTTGQEFTGEAIDRVFHYTAGQPWLVNAIAREITEAMDVQPPDTITADHVEHATRRLISARTTHLDSLANRLNEPRIKRIIEPIIAGESIHASTEAVYNNDKLYVADLGLVNANTNPITIANPIYHEVISRLLAQDAIDATNADPGSFLLPNERIDLDKILRGFVTFWRKEGGLMAAGKGYSEAGAQLVLLGYLYKIINGGGFVDSEPGLGQHHVDVLIRKPYNDPDGKRAVQHEVIELKVWRDKDGDPVNQGLRQLDTYLAKLGLDTGTLIIFDRRSTAAPLEERGTFSHTTTDHERRVQLLRV